MKQYTMESINKINNLSLNNEYTPYSELTQIEKIRKEMLDAENRWSHYKSDSYSTKEKNIEELLYFNKIKDCQLRLQNCDVK